MSLTTEYRLTPLTTLTNQIYQLLERQNCTALRKIEQSILIDFQLDLYNLGKLTITIDNGASSPETAVNTRYCRRRVLLFRRRLTDVANTPVLRNRLNIVEIDWLLSRLIRALNELTDELENCRC